MEYLISFYIHVVQIIQSDEVCETSYRDKKGKYQKQTGITLPKIK